MKKRGQITIFVILGIIILAIIVFAIFLRSEILADMRVTEVKEISGLSLEAQNNANAINECLESLAYLSIINAGETAGFFDKETNTFEYSNTPVYVLFSGAQSFMPERSVLENNLANNLLIHASECVLNIDSRLKITSGKIEDVNVEVMEDKVAYNIEWPVRFESEDFSERLTHFNFDINVRLGAIHSVVDNFLNDQINEPTGICFSCLIDLAQRNNLFIRATPMLDKYVFLVEDSTNEDPYMFLFGGMLN